MSGLLSAKFEVDMIRDYFAAAAAGATLGIMAVSAIWGPAAPAKAGELPSEMARFTLLPQSVVEAAQAEGETPALPLPDLDASDRVRLQTPKSSDADAVQPTGSLSSLVAQHAATEAPDREGHCLAVAVYFESKGEPLAGQLAVAQTILNRTRSGRFPASICGVVLQKSQFSFVRSGLPAVPKGTIQWKTAVGIAHIARNNLWAGGMNNALFFHARHVAPGWRLTRLGSVGNHIFYK